MRAYLARARRTAQGYGPDGKLCTYEYVVDEGSVKGVFGVGTFDESGRIDLAKWYAQLTVVRERGLAVVRALNAGLPASICEAPGILDDDGAKRFAAECYWGTKADGTGGCNGNVYLVIEEEE